MKKVLLFLAIGLYFGCTKEGIVSPAKQNPWIVDSLTLEVKLVNQSDTVNDNDEILLVFKKGYHYQYVGGNEDAPFLQGDSELSLYSLAPNASGTVRWQAIGGFPDTLNEKPVLLGYEAKQKSSYSLSFEPSQALPPGVSMWLHDTDLPTDSVKAVQKYQFESVPGTFNGRFSLTFSRDQQ